MAHSTYSLLKKLANAHGTSGYEEKIREIIREELEDHVDEFRTDSMGNLIAIKKGKKPSVMLAAHMDEIGLVVKNIDKNGFIRFVKFGGWYDPTLLNSRVILHGEKGKIYGVIGSKPPHMMKDDGKKSAIKAEDMFIDIGAKSREEVERKGIKVGTPITLDMDIRRLANNRVTGKSLDDRVGITMMIEAVKRYRGNATIYAVGTVQEEVGLKGARTSAFSLNPDVAIVCEVAVAGDHPGVEERNSQIKLDEGAVITVADASGRGLISHPSVVRWLENVAKKRKIKYQMEVSEGGTTDAAVIHITREGIPSGVISVPTRYMHSGVEVISMNDLEESIKLLTEALENLDGLHI
ncbi:MAG: M42 family metallopeptidase [Thermoplasmata archaeon]|nr:M42 family metallopeptidase [Thermoplasmata archaeon]